MQTIKAIKVYNIKGTSTVKTLLNLILGMTGNMEVNGKNLFLFNQLVKLEMVNYCEKRILKIWRSNEIECNPMSSDGLQNFEIKLHKKTRYYPTCKLYLHKQSKF